MQIILSSANAKKIIEIQAILSDVDVRSYRDFLDEVEIVEDGESFEENALLKAKKIYELLESRIEQDFLVLADDSGICVEALGGMPSIYSARFASIEASVQDLIKKNFPPPLQSNTDENNNLKLLASLEELGITESRASFVCVIAICGRVGDQKIQKTFYGECEGRVVKAPLNPQAFGYDPLFVPNGYDVTMDQLKEKNLISHRFLALQKFQDFLKKIDSISTQNLELRE